MLPDAACRESADRAEKKPLQNQQLTALAASAPLDRASGLPHNEAMSDRSRFIGLSSLLDLVEAAIYSGRVADRNRVSLLLVASPESCKTQLLFYFSKVPTVRYFSSLTAKPLLALRNDLEAGRITHIALQDLCSAFAHSKSASERLLIWLAMLMDEGATTFADAGGTVEFRGLPRLGVLAAITPEIYADQRYRWHRTGLISRFLPVYFRYRQPTIDLIHDAIRDGVSLPDPTAGALPEQSVDVLIPQEIAYEIERRARHLARIHSTHGFRFHKTLRLLLRGRALALGKTEVTSEEVSKLDEWIRFMDPNSPGEI